MTSDGMSRRARALPTLALLAGLLVAASACTSPAPERTIPPTATPSRSTSSPSPTPDAVREGPWRVADGVASLATGLAVPWSVVPLGEPGGDSTGALISERNSGLIRELTPDGSLRDVATVPGVVAGGEAGLHGLALWRDDDETWLYAYHGAADDNRVVRFSLTGGRGALSLGEPELILSRIPRANNHDGGRIAFGPDGYLYVATGDAQNGDASQDPDSLGGKILRLTPQGAPAPGNPFGNAVWSLGHRNVQGLAWTADGTMWASEFGQNTWDELNRIEPGINYGWPIVEGAAGDARFVDPVAVWAPAEASPSGIAAVGDTVFIAGLRGGRLWAIDVTGGEPVAALGDQGRLRDVVAAPDGSLWVLTNNTDGRGSPRSGDDLLLRVPIQPAG